MSTLVLDTITGKSTSTTITIGSTPVVSASANSMTIRGEGSAQTSIQQGLLKCFLTLNGTGTYANAYTTNMGSTNYAILTGEVAQTDIGTESNSTDHHDILGRQGFDSTTIDVDPFYIGVAGDLA